MVIYRLPRRLSFSNPPKSFCPKCKHSLAPIDLIPLLSWLSTGGKCRYCRAPIAPRYFLVELLTASLFGTLWYVYLVVGFEPVRLGFYAAAVAALVAIIFIDWELYIIPDEINAVLLVIGVAMHTVLGSLEVALWGALAGWGLLWGIAFFGRVAFGKDAMGHGDIKMMRGVGAIIGPVLLLANLGIAVVAGLVIGLILIAVESRRAKAGGETGADEAPYVPEPIGDLLKAGVFYLLCLDLVGIFWRGIYNVFGFEYTDESIEDDTWEPTLTTIPFGPYLALGSLACMLFAGPIEGAIDAYWRNATGDPQAFTRDLRPTVPNPANQASKSSRLKTKAARYEPASRQATSSAREMTVLQPSAGPEVLRKLEQEPGNRRQTNGGLWGKIYS
jgi:leader peptidase (prepilin peptidase) / N-methyltransferase